MSTAGTLFPDPPERPQPEQAAAQGPRRGPTHGHRGARIECGPGGHVRGLFLAGHPLDGTTFGAVGAMTPLVDLWLDGGRLPGYMRAVPKGRA